MLFVSALPVALAAAGPIGAAVAADGDNSATVATAPSPGDIPFVQELLERSRANKAKYDEEVTHHLLAMPLAASPARRLHPLPR
ncbi:unnamed protein product [Closterium sp. NIES-54]